jgi:hypothetical protein
MFSSSDSSNDLIFFCRRSFFGSSDERLVWDDQQTNNKSTLGESGSAFDLVFGILVVIYNRLQRFFFELEFWRFFFPPNFS